MEQDQARVNLGTKKGVWKGMYLWADCEGSRWAEVVEIHDDDCIIESNHPLTVYKKGESVSSWRHEQD
jgi:hypothetical protein